MEIDLMIIGSVIAGVALVGWLLKKWKNKADEKSGAVRYRMARAVKQNGCEMQLFVFWENYGYRYQVFNFDGVRRCELASGVKSTFPEALKEGNRAMDELLNPAKK
jgi:hypothetical protein